MFSKTKESTGEGAPAEILVPILCKLWAEDGVWNGVTEDLSVAVFGSTYEEASENLRQAIECHMEAAVQTGSVGALIAHLQERAKEYGFLSLDEITPGSSLLKMLVAMKNQEIVAVTA
ncbi:hypothetical protein LCGC14_2375040 [marine sediment metagenome]|uniref:HicB-like antitoxin of toxin-antitoxin system domain-containing protein n=1 Tax=marine sediment metagenome TaxID=412755 RepID=A0A0F9EF17_9ZZZZ